MTNSDTADTSRDTEASAPPGGVVAVVLANDFEDVEFTEPRDALLDAGFGVEVIGSESGTVTGKKGTEVTIDRTVSGVDPDAYVGLLIPGGFSPDRLRTDEAIVSFVADLFDRPIPTAAICHAPSLLIEAAVVEGRRLTSYQSIRTDLANAGADVVDAEVVIDDNLITSRNPGDLPAFIDALLDALRTNASLTRGLAAEPKVIEQTPTT